MSSSISNQEDLSPLSYFGMPNLESDELSETEKNEQILRLARQITHQSEISKQLTNNSNAIKPISTDFNPFISKENPILDPHSEKFDPYSWAQHMLKIYHTDPEKYPKLNAGVSFKNLGAFGYTQDDTYQSTVYNVFIQTGNSLLNFVRGRKGDEVKILQNFNGLIKSGETCVVLGRPGA